MKRRNWDAKTKTKVVLEGFRVETYRRFAMNTEFNRPSIIVGVISF